jgi:two-component system sensor histidine kinase KdpD
MLAVTECDVWIRDPETGRLVSALHPSHEAGERHEPLSSGFALSSTSLVHWVAEHGRACAELADGTIRTAPEPSAAALSPSVALAPEVRALSMPLSVRGRTVGVLRLASDRAIVLDQQRSRFLDALAYYAALGVERVRLSAEAERAESLREAGRLKDGVLASVSHDIRTPLTTIRALAHDLAADGDERALIIEEEVERLNRFVTDLLDLSRLRAGAVPLAIAINAAEHVMGAALQQVSGKGEGREIRASLDPAEPLLVGRFDFAHSLRILVNLLDNALKYSPPDSPIDFTVRREGDSLVFRVADRGRASPPRSGSASSRRSIVRPVRPPMSAGQGSASRSHAGWPSRRAGR